MLRSLLHMLLCSVLVSVCACGTSSPRLLTHPLDEKVLQEFYSSYPIGALGLAEPIRVRAAGQYLDGGTLYAVFQGADGDSLVLCWDGRMQFYSDPNFGDPLYAYRDARHPSESAAVRLPLYGEVEKAAFRIALDFRGMNPPNFEKRVEHFDRELLEFVVDHEEIRRREVSRLIDRLTGRLARVPTDESP